LPSPRAGAGGEQGGPVFPGTTFELGSLKLDSAAAAGEYVVTWRLSTEGGEFPPPVAGKQQRGFITLTMTR